MATKSKRSESKEELWRLLVEQQRRSGLSIRAFCRQRAISEPSFYAWRKKLQKRQAGSRSDAGSNGRLIPVEVIGSTCEKAPPNHDEMNGPLEICTPGGYTLRFGHEARPDTIARLLDVIARCPAAGAPSC